LQNAPLPNTPMHAPHSVGGATALGIGIPHSSQPPAGKGMHGRTMLGVPLASLSPLPRAPETSSSSSQHVSPAVPSPATSTNGSANVSPSNRSTLPPGASLPPAAAASGTRALIAGVLAALAVLALATMLYVRLSNQPRTADVRAHITTTEQGESLQFDVPSAAEGARLRFGGQEQPLVSGHTSFPLASDSLRVGDNIVLADVIAPNGEIASARIVLAVSYRLWVDLAGLSAARPSLDVKVAALPKTRVTLESEDIALDDQGRGAKTFALDTVRPGKGGVIDHIVHYQIQPPTGEAVMGQLHTRVPVAVLQIDRPGNDLITESDTVEIAGAVGRDTEVSIDGRQVSVKEGRFLQRLALPKPGEYKPRITASAPGKIPTSLTLSIRRVRDLAQAAREFTFDKSLTYAKIATSPTSYRGQPIAIEGRVYAVDSRGGPSVIQMLARPCPSSQRCSLWVVDPQASEVAVDRWVRVLGVVDGEQQFRSESDQVVTVPKVIARFILPSKP
jgi:hypothetical protein